MGQGNIIGKPNLPATTGSKGLWSLREQYAANRESTWPGYDPQWANTTLLVKTAPAVAGTNVTPVAVSTIGSPTFGNPGPYAGYSSVTITTNTFQESVNVLDSTMAIGTSDFTVECWVRFNSLTGGVIASSKYANNQNNIYWILSVSSGGKPSFNTRGNAPGGNGFYSDWGATSTNVTLTTGVWYHMAGVRQSGVLKLYIDGVLMNTTQSDSYVPLSEAVVSVGFFNYTSYTGGLNGSVSNFRVTKSAVYTANFSRPTTPVGTIANTVLLLNFDNAPARPIDATGRNTLASTATIVTTPARFDGDALSFSGSASITTTATAGNTLAGNFAFGTGDFTIEAWIYPTSASGDRCIFSTRGNQANAVYFGCYTNAYTLGYYTAGGWALISNTAVPANAWSHVALVRVSGVAYFYLNGTCVGSVANTTNLTESVGTVGRSTGDNAYGWIGQLDEVRVTKFARYNGTFTPVGPFDRDWEPPYNDTLVTSNVLQLKAIGVGGATNNVFRDDSTNNFTPTRFGDTTQGSLSPYIPTGYWSAYFDGTGDYLTVASNAGLQFATSDFTIECWVNKATTGVQNLLVWGAGGGGGANDIVFYTGSNNELAFYANTTVRISGPSLMLNKWHHIAAVRQSGTTRLYIDGIQVGSWVDATNYTASILAVGWSGSTWNGHISNLRVVKGTAVYTGSIFTPPTAPLTAIANTSLLALQDNRLIDRSTNNFALARFGDVSIARFSPFPFAVPVTTVATTNAYGGSGYFDGSGDYLTLPTSSAFTMGTGDFTVECWVLSTGVSNANGIFQISDTTYFNSTNGIALHAFSNGAWYIYTGAGLFTAGTWVPNTWYHCAVVRSSGVTRLYVNGVVVITQNDTTNYTGTYLGVGGVFDNTDSNKHRGFISNFRVVKGTAVYTAPFTPPTSPVTAISGTSLLLNFDNAGVYDGTGINVLNTSGASLTSSAQQKYDAASLLFNGAANDFVSVPHPAPHLAFGTGDFTVEFWAYRTVSAQQIFYGHRPSANGAYATIYCEGATLYYYANTANQITGPTLATGQWYHVALCRAASQTRLFVNGTAYGPVADTTNYQNSAGRPMIGNNELRNGGYAYTGYIENLRISRVGRYTANFTVPSESFPVA